jgi:hypothetical protein
MTALTVGVTLTRWYNVVYVDSYVRRRKGRLEYVCAHFRAWPGQQMVRVIH